MLGKRYATITSHVLLYIVMFFVIFSSTLHGTISKLGSLKANLAQITPLANVSFVLASSQQLGCF